MSGPTARQVIRESARAANRRPWRTLTIALAVAAMCVSVFATTGQSIAVERRVRERLEAPEARVISMTWREDHGGIDPGIVERLSGLTGVEWALGRGPAMDLVNASLPGGRPCPAVVVVGSLPEPTFRFSQGGQPGASQALTTGASRLCLGLTHPSGTLAVSGGRPNDGERLFVAVGEAAVGPELGRLSRLTLLRAEDPTEVVEVFISVSEARLIPEVSRAALTLSGVSDTTSLSIDSSTVTLELQTMLERELAENARIVALAVLAAGMGFVGLALALSVGSQRRDFGRRRALGASRSMLTTLVLLEGSIPALLGAIGGTAAGVAILALVHDLAPSPAFVVAVPVLAIVAVVVASIPAALTAAFRDPVAVLRVP